jgi:hypothetical protein
VSRAERRPAGSATAELGLIFALTFAAGLAHYGLGLG